MSTPLPTSQAHNDSTKITPTATIPLQATCSPRISPNLRSSFPTRNSSLRKPSSFSPSPRNVTFKEDVKGGPKVTATVGAKRVLQHPNPLSPNSPPVSLHERTRSFSSTSTDSGSSTSTIKPIREVKPSPASPLPTLQPRTYVPPITYKPSYSASSLSRSATARPGTATRSISTPVLAPEPTLEYLQPRTYIPPTGWDPAWRPLAAPPSDYTPPPPPPPPQQQQQQQNKRPAYPPRTSSLPSPGVRSPLASPPAPTAARPESPESALVPIKMSMTPTEAANAMRPKTLDEEMDEFEAMLAELPDLRVETARLKGRLEAHAKGVERLEGELRELTAMGRGLMEEVEGWFMGC